MFESLLLIVVVVELVWILSSIFRGTEEDRRGQQRPPLTPRPPGAPASRPRPPATTVDRFLEEINRRRREAAERQGATPTAQSSAPASPKPRSEPPRRQPRPAPSILSPQPTRPGAPRRVPTLEVVVAEVQYPQVEAIDARRAPPAAKPAFRPAPTAPPEKVVVAEVLAVTPPPALAVPTPRSRPASRRAAQLIALLHNRQMLGNALLLHEILGPPLCERGG
jgi:hypothetical protein